MKRTILFSLLAGIGILFFAQPAHAACGSCGPAGYDGGYTMRGACPMMETMPMAPAMAPSAEPMMPAICGSVAYTADTKYLSLPGYLRWQHFQETGVWLTWQQTHELAGQQSRQCLAK
jgi:hypothetical protein